MLATIWGLAGLCVTVGLCGFAAAIGERPERRAASAVVAGTTISLLAQALLHRPDPAVLGAVAAAVLWALVRLTWKSGRVWPTFAVGLQGLVVAVHLLRLVAPGLPARSYSIAVSVADAGVLIVLAAGAWAAWRKRSRLKAAETN